MEMPSRRRRRTGREEPLQEFVINISTPTGHLLRGATHYLLPSIRRLARKKKREVASTDVVATRTSLLEHESLAFVFNKSLPDICPELSPVSECTVCRWFKELFPKYELSPLQSDYCDTCAEIKKQLDTLRRQRQNMLDNGNTDPVYIANKDRLISSYEALLRSHRHQAESEQREYKARFSSASSALAIDSGASHVPELVLICDFQMGKLIPHWGQSAQPGKTYYYQKVMHHLFGIVDATNKQNYIYVMDDIVAGDTDADHVCSFLWNYVQQLPTPRPPILHVYLDSAPCFKSRFVILWGAELVAQGIFKKVIFSYIVPGHTKFEPDALFSQIANRF